MRCVFRLILSVLLLLFVAGALFQWNFVINTTESFPKGIYRKKAREFRKGDLVLICPPDRPIFHDALEVGLLAPGLCPGGLGYLIKRVAATEGDFVEIATTGVTINGEYLGNSQRQSIRLEHIEMPVSRELQGKEVVLMSPHPLSFDSRSFGGVPVSSVLTSLEPLFLFSGTGHERH